MKLLICTQKVDAEDSDLGFFVRWIEEFKKHCEVEVISLKDLGNGGRLSRAYNLLAKTSTLDFDAVFVHMNPEYCVAAGWYWRLRGKKIGLWYTHKAVNVRLRIATLFANIIFTASKESFRLNSSKVHVMGHGIDTNFFTPDPSVHRGDHYLSVGRLSKSKRHDLAILVAGNDGQKLKIAGEGPELENLKEEARVARVDVEFLGPLTHAQLRDEYRKASQLIHTSETGSLDKVVLEALASGLPIMTRDGALKYLENKGPEYVREYHSLSSLIPAILALYGSTGK